MLKGALDLNQIDIANQCLASLQLQFPKYVRVEKLEALVCEASGDTESAEDIYDALLEKNPGDQFSMKRRVAICKSHGATEQAIAELNKYLKLCSCDSDAYAELADLYLSLGDQRKALFCMEEVILSHPNHHVFLVKCAELLYTLRDYSASRKYYAQALLLLPLDYHHVTGSAVSGSAVSGGDTGSAVNDRDLHATANRALYGLLMACNASSQQQQQQGKQKDAAAATDAQKNSKLMKMAQEKLMKLHLAHHSPLTETLQEMLLSLLS